MPTVKMEVGPLAGNAMKPTRIRIGFMTGQNLLSPSFGRLIRSKHDVAWMSIPTQVPRSKFGIATMAKTSNGLSKTLNFADMAVCVLHGQFKDQARLLWKPVLAVQNNYGGLNLAP